MEILFHKTIEQCRQLGAKFPARLRKRPTKPVCAWTRNFRGWPRPSLPAPPAKRGRPPGATIDEIVPLTVWDR
jgi:hypothetical protein